MTGDLPSTGLEHADGDLRIEAVRVSTGVYLVEPHGQADLHTAPALRESLSQAIDDGASVLVVDLGGVSFIDSMTLGVLLGAVKRLRPRGGQLRIVVTDPHVRRVFEITLLDRVFDLYGDREQALERV